MSHFQNMVEGDMGVSIRFSDHVAPHNTPLV